MSFDIKEFKSDRHDGVLRSMGICNGVTLATCLVCRERKQYCEKYIWLSLSRESKKQSLSPANLLNNGAWFCSETCLAFYILRRLM